MWLKQFQHWCFRKGVRSVGSVKWFCFRGLVPEYYVQISERVVWIGLVIRLLYTDPTSLPYILAKENVF